jgi:hypothetical protein
MNRRVVCAANKHTNGVILLGARHWDAYMRDQFFERKASDATSHDFEQGFIDNRGNFLTRTEAWKIAEVAGQIISRCGGDTTNGGTLFSENLY